MTRHRAETQAVSLFPMFNILVATLGVFVFMLITIVVISIGIGKAVVFVPEAGDSRRVDKSPVYLEWTGNSLILYPEKLVLEIDRDLRRIRSWEATYRYLDQAMEGTAFAAVLENVKSAEADSYLIIVVRPDGFRNFIELKGYFQEHGIDIGYEPIEAGTEFTGEAP